MKICFEGKIFIKFFARIHDPSFEIPNEFKLIVILKQFTEAKYFL